MFPCITKPTRITTKTATLIDNIFCNDLITDDSGLAGILYTDISDHFPVFYINHSYGTKDNPKYFQKKLYSQTNIEACVRDKDWSDVLSCNDPQSAYTAFHNDFTTMYDECFPLRTLKYGYKTRKPWLSEGLKKSIQRKNQLVYRKPKSNKPEDELLYKDYRNELNKLMYVAERDYHEKCLEENKHNLKKNLGRF